MGDELKNELRAWLRSILVLVLGILVLLTVKYWINDRAATTGDAVLVVLLVMPILVYTIVSGRLQEFGGPGGIVIRLKEVATAGVSGTIGGAPVAVHGDEAQVLTKGGSPLEVKLRSINEDQPIILKLTFGMKNVGQGYTYSAGDLLDYVRRLSRACRHLSQARAQTRWTPARKFLAVFS